jgi:hypothetical protein
MVHQIGNIVIYNVYLLPETKSWVGDLESDPCLALASSLAVAYAFHILIMGDLNARTGFQTLLYTTPYAIHWMRNRLQLAGDFIQTMHGLQLNDYQWRRTVWAKQRRINLLPQNCD